MVNSNIYNYINVLDKAADAGALRNQVISENIANAQTPGYKRKDVAFEAYLQEELAGAESNTLADMVADVELGHLLSTSYTDMSDLSYRLDGNNVDIYTENVELASNQIKYNAVLDSISHQFSMIKTALTTS